MTKEQLLERYEAVGDDCDFLAANRLYERALAEAPDARVLNDYGYLLECHGRRELRRAVELYERAIELDPGYDMAHYQLISARARTAGTGALRRELRASARGFAGRGAGATLPRTCLFEDARLRAGACGR